MSKKTRAVIGVGGNLPSAFGDVLPTVLESVRRIGEIDGITLVAQSPVYRSKAWPEGSDQPDYANMAILVDVSMNASELLRAMQEIENSMGRMREERWGARVIDLDLLAYEELILPNKGLWLSVAGSEDPMAYLEEVTVPHPRLHKRLFAIKPFADVCPDWYHPVLGHSASQIEALVSKGEKQPLTLYERQ